MLFSYAQPHLELWYPCAGMGVEEGGGRGGDDARKGVNPLAQLFYEGKVWLRAAFWLIAAMLTCRRKIALTHCGLSPQQGKGHPSIDPNVILVRMRERVKIEWRLVPCVICL